MGKRRNATIKPQGSATTSNNCAAGDTKDDKYSHFDFGDDDLQVEIQSRNTLAKFATKSPRKKPLLHRHPVDNYAFLECFAQGATSLKHTGTDMLDADDTDNVFQDIIVGTDVTMSLGSLNYESKPFSSPKFQDIDSCGAKSCAPKTRKPGRCTAGKKHNKILNVDPDEDGILQLRSLSSFNLAENEGILEEKSTEFGANSNDCEAVVVVAPYYVKYGKYYYTRCQLTFSQNCIRLEGSPLCDGKRTHCLEWSTFDILNIERQQCESDKADVVILQMKSKDTNVGETGDWSSGSVELEFVVIDDPLWPEKEEEIKSLDLKYKAAWKTNVSECNFKESFDNMLYPKGDPDAVFISRRDIELLQPRTFINDTIIDFYIKYLFNKIKPVERQRFHFFNTFFFRKLDAVRQDSSRAWKGRDAFQSIHKWTRNVNIFETEYIFLPVNFSLHWSLIIICHPGEVSNKRDKVMDESSNVPCILHMDSIRGSHAGFENLIRNYLWEEWTERSNTHEENIKMKFLTLEFVSLQLPQQENLFDCGLFLLHYVELFLEQTSDFNKTKYLDILNKDWFLPAAVSLKKRDHIRKLIHRIVEDNFCNDSPAARDDKYLQSFGINEGDGNVNFAQNKSVKESCSGVMLNSSDVFYIKGEQSSVPMMEKRSIDKSATDECFEPCKLMLPTHQFSNLSLPVEEEAFQEQIASGQGGITSRRSHTDTPMPSHCQLCTDFRCGGMNDPMETGSKDCFSDKSLIIIDVRNEEDSGKSSMSSEDLAACVVEDSEDESTSIPRTRMVSPVYSTSEQTMQH